MVRFRKRKKYKQGIYQVKNRKKYHGTIPCIYRSGWELKFYRWCDNNSSVISWCGESIAIPYVSPIDGRIHRYFVDGMLTIRNADKSQHKYLVEIKPSKQVHPPKVKNRKSTKTLLKEQYIYAINIAKWRSAKQWCKKHNYKFIILTEKELNIKN